jgi:hypothetical protein
MIRLQQGLVIHIDHLKIRANNGTRETSPTPRELQAESRIANSRRAVLDNSRKETLVRTTVKNQASSNDYIYLGRISWLHNPDTSCHGFELEELDFVFNETEKFLPKLCNE